MTCPEEIQDHVVGDPTDNKMLFLYWQVFTRNKIQGKKKGKIDLVPLMKINKAVKKPCCLFSTLLLPNDGTATSQLTSYFSKKNDIHSSKAQYRYFARRTGIPDRDEQQEISRGQESGVESIPPRCYRGSSKVLIKGPFPETNWDTPSQVISFHFHKALFWWASHWKHQAWSSIDTDHLLTCWGCRGLPQLSG